MLRLKFVIVGRNRDQANKWMLQETEDMNRKQAERRQKSVTRATQPEVVITGDNVGIEFVCGETLVSELQDLFTREPDFI